MDLLRLIVVLVSLNVAAGAQAACTYTLNGPVSDFNYSSMELTVGESNGTNLTVGVPVEFYPLKKGLDVEFTEGVCNKTSLNYDGQTLRYRTMTTCDFAEGARATIDVTPDLKVVTRARGYRIVYLVPIPFPHTFDHFSCER